MKQIYVLLFFVTAVLAKPRRDEIGKPIQISDSGVCKDQQTCAHCTSNRYKCDYDSTVQNQCKRTCGLCPGSCQDNAGCSWCNYNEMLGYCSNPDFSKDCRFTCGLCTGK